MNWNVCKESGVVVDDDTDAWRPDKMKSSLAWVPTSLVEASSYVNTVQILKSLH
jgi:hypothetical protein